MALSWPLSERHQKVCGQCANFTAAGGRCAVKVSVPYMRVLQVWRDDIACTDGFRWERDAAKAARVVCD